MYVYPCVASTLTQKRGILEVVQQTNARGYLYNKQRDILARFSQFLAQELRFRYMLLIDFNFFFSSFSRRETLQMRTRRLRSAIRQLLGPQETLARAHLGQTVQLPGERLRQVVHASVVAA